MRIALVGSDYEENLGIAMVAASLTRAKHRVAVVTFNELCDLDATLEAILLRRPRLVGLAAQFQHRAFDFLLLARRLRKAGFQGHVTCGGQWPTLTANEILDQEPGVDSVVLHEGEQTMVELAAALQQGTDLSAVAGLALRGPDGKPMRTTERRLCDDLDSLPFAHRYRRHTRQLGIPFIPMYASRGCWGSCAYCAITTYYRDAQQHGGARKLRLRSPENVAAEMAALYHSVGGPCTFCFHDDTLLLPRPADTLQRLRAIRRSLDEFGVGKVGLIGKAHPECVTPGLARELARLGVIRMFLGVENASQPGLDHLNRRTTTAEVERAVEAFDCAGIMVCYNLLLFEPDARLADIRENIEFVRQFSHIPVNFCRAEPYHGTPLYDQMRQRGTLNGCFLGWNYRIADDRTELMFRICSSAFRDRNFDARGVANRYMGTAYLAQLLRSYYDCSSSRAQRLLERSERLITDITRDTADLLSEAADLAQTVSLEDHDRVERETALLGLRVAAHDRVWHAQIDDLNADIERFAAEHPVQIARRNLPSRLAESLQGFAIAGCVAALVGSCGSTTEDTDGSGGAAASSGSDAGSPDATTGGGSSGSGGAVGDGGAGGSGGYVGDGGAPTGGYGGSGGYVGDGGAPTGGYGGTGGFVGDGGGPTGGTGGTGGFWGDGGAPTGGYGGTGGTGGFVGDGGAPGGGYGGTGGFVGDGGGPTGGYGGNGNEGGVSGLAGMAGNGGEPAGGGSGYGGSAGTVVDPPPPDAGAGGYASNVEHWHDTSPRRAARTRDLGNHAPPLMTLAARRDGDAVRVGVRGVWGPMSLRWESDGRIEGEGPEVTWHPKSEEDQIRVAVRIPGGVAVTALRVREVRRG